MAAGRLHMTRIVKRLQVAGDLRAQVQFSVTFISTFNLSSLI